MNTSHKTVFLALGLAALGLGAVGLSSAKDAKAASAPESARQVSAAQEIKNANYVVTVDAAACKAKAECSVSVKLEAQGGFHLNKEYPHKVKVADGSGFAWAKKEFGKSSGDFAESGEKVGTVTLKFTPEKAGKVELAGTFKFAVCSEASCNPSSEDLKFSVDVK
jgi:hypothetical protein